MRKSFQKLQLVFVVFFMPYKGCSGNVHVLFTLKGLKGILLVVCIRRHKKRDYGNCNQFSSNFDMACWTIQRVSVPNLKSFGTI